MLDLINRKIQSGTNRQAAVHTKVAADIARVDIARKLKAVAGRAEPKVIHVCPTEV